MERLLLSSWWVLLFILLSTVIYEQGVRTIATDYTQLCSQHHSLLSEKEFALAEQQELLQRVQGQSDPEWIELTLKSGLGLVPEGQTKVYFQPRMIVK